MLWVYVLAGTAGIVMLVPSLLQAIDGQKVDVTVGALGFTGTVFAICGLILQQFDMSTNATWVAALALGMAAGALHSEVLNALRPSHPEDPAEDTAENTAETTT